MRRRAESYWTGLHVALDRISWKVSTVNSLEEVVGEGEDSHIQSWSTRGAGGYSSGAAFLPSPPSSSPSTVGLCYRYSVEAEMVLSLPLSNRRYH